MSLDTEQSVYREQLLEHLVLGQLLQHSWLHDHAALEVSQPAIDRAGHAVVLEAHEVTRHVQVVGSFIEDLKEGRGDESPEKVYEQTLRQDGGYKITLITYDAD